MPQSLQDRILAVTHLRLRGSDRQKQLKQIIEAIGKLTDDDWVKLDPVIQQWYEDCFGGKDELDKAAKIKDFQAQAAAPAAQPPKSAKEDNTVAKSKHNGKQRKVAKAGSKTEGAPVLIRRWLNKNPKLSATELYDRLVERGSAASKFTVAATRSIHIATLRELAKSGHLKGIPI